MATTNDQYGESPQTSPLDFNEIREQGINYLGSIAGATWTDYNAHDPGITILEQLCYALTDLSYRIGFDMQDLLSSDVSESNESLYSPEEIFSSNPVTLTDLRKIVLDIEGVKNAWVEKVAEKDAELFYDPSDQGLYLESAAHRKPIPLQGVLQVLVEGDRTLAAPQIIRSTRSQLHANRNLCQAIVQPMMLSTQAIPVEAIIEIEQVDDPNQLLAEIYLAIALHISPNLNFYNKKALLENGYTIDEIIDGPILDRGFTIDNELAQFKRKLSLRSSDVIQTIMNVPGVIAVNEIKVLGEPWYVTLDSNSAPYFDDQSSNIQLARSHVIANLDLHEVKRKFNLLYKVSTASKVNNIDANVKLPVGKDRNVGRYHSLQHQFPSVYGIGEYGLPASASRQRHANAKQLKAYLLLFDQLMANYFAQLAHAKDLFSFKTGATETYFSQVIEDDRLQLNDVRIGNSLSQNDTLREITEGENSRSNEQKLGRKNRFLNHLLARFSEDLSDYSMLYHGTSLEKLIEDKSKFLRDYRELGADKGRAINLLSDDKYSGLEKRIYRKLGIRYAKRILVSDMDAAHSEGGFYLLEHILLAPQVEDMSIPVIANSVRRESPALLSFVQKADPYSHQLSFIFPNWIERFNAKGFHELISKTIQAETPAHIHVHFHWLDKQSMQAYEAAYQDWLNSFRSVEDENLLLRDARDRMLMMLKVGVPIPLPDLVLTYPQTVAHEEIAEIYIHGAQVGVRYQLCDEDGFPIVIGEQEFYIEPSKDSNSDGAILIAPKMVKDITYTISATRLAPSWPDDVEVYLNQVVSIKAGINSKLAINYIVGNNQQLNNGQLFIPYNDKFDLTIDGSQEGVSYQIQIDDLSSSVLSEPMAGNKGNIELHARKIEEDTPIKILAYRTLNSEINTYMDRRLLVNVRPNPEVQIIQDKKIVDYNGTMLFTIKTAQANVEYQLFQSQLVEEEYVQQESKNTINVQVDNQRNVYIRKPIKNTDWSISEGFVSVGLFQPKANSLVISTDTLQEDTLFVVQATKNVNGSSVQLSQALTVLVRPNTSPQVLSTSSTVAKGAEAMITVNGTQKGVSYQLRNDSNNTLVNLPGYDLRDRGIERLRVAVDFTVEDKGGELVLLPSNAINKKTTFNINAEKILTGLTATLDEKVSVGVSSN